jgi:cytochrome c oxidase subunit 4
MLREKEKGDWKKLTSDEKKSLYRASFCQTFAEVEAPTGEWKGIIGLALAIISTGLWGYIWLAKYGESLPAAVYKSPESKSLGIPKAVILST